MLCNQQIRSFSDTQETYLGITFLSSRKGIDEQISLGSKAKLNLIWMANDLMVSHFSLTKTVNLENYGKAGECKDLTFPPNEIQSLSLYITMFLCFFGVTQNYFVSFSQITNH